MFPGAEPYVSLVENVGFCGKKHNRVAQLLVYFLYVFFNQGKRGGKVGPLPFGDKKGRLP